MNTYITRHSVMLSTAFTDYLRCQHREKALEFLPVCTMTKLELENTLLREKRHSTLKINNVGQLIEIRARNDAETSHNECSQPGTLQ
jgi:hypothetical protein